MFGKTWRLGLCAALVVVACESDGGNPDEASDACTGDRLKLEPEDAPCELAWLDCIETLDCGSMDRDATIAPCSSEFDACSEG